MSVGHPGAVPPQIAQGLEAALQHVAGGETFAANQPSNPAGEQAAAPADPAGSAKQADPDFAAKYGTSKEALDKQLFDLRNGYSQKADEATALRAELAELKAATQSGRVMPNGYPNGYASAQQPDPLDELEKTYGVPRALLSGGVQRMVSEQVNATLSPLVKAAEAEQKAIERYGPGYSQVKPMIDTFVAGNPDVQAMVNAARQNGLPELANDYALAKFREAYAQDQHARITGAAGATTQTVEQARAHAGVLTGRTSDTRTQFAGGQQQAIDPAEAIARANAGDDRMLMAKAKELLVPWSEEYLQGVMSGKVFMPGQI